MEILGQDYLRNGLCIGFKTSALLVMTLTLGRRQVPEDDNNGRVLILPQVIPRELRSLQERTDTEA